MRTRLFIYLHWPWEKVRKTAKTHLKDVSFVYYTLDKKLTCSNVFNEYFTWAVLVPSHELTKSLSVVRSNPGIYLMTWFVWGKWSDNNLIKWLALWMELVWMLAISNKPLISIAHSQSNNCFNKKSPNWIGMYRKFWTNTKTTCLNIFHWMHKQRWAIYSDEQNKTQHIEHSGELSSNINFILKQHFLLD